MRRNWVKDMWFGLVGEVEATRDDFKEAMSNPFLAILFGSMAGTVLIILIVGLLHH